MTGTPEPAARDLVAVLGGGAAGSSAAAAGTLVLGSLLGPLVRAGLLPGPPELPGPGGAAVLLALVGGLVGSVLVARRRVPDVARRA